MRQKTMFFDQKALIGRHILVVEDDYFAAAHVKDCLRTHGATIEGPWSNVEHAMSSLDRSIDCIDSAVLDIDLQDGKRSYPIAKRLDWAGIPYIFASAHPLSQIPEEYRDCLNIGKPHSDHRLICGLSQLLEGTFESKLYRALTRLGAVSRHIQAGERRVAQQRERVARFRGMRHSLNLAEELLEELLNSLSALEDTRAKFLDELRLIQAGAL
ncbi:response regulator [Methylobacterium radiotolerans]|uniref:hypothetical protein n=1 Tax=Methylobacterium radiotolerans TaxID=31998 RepID=UPI0010578D47|nr:MULTISPECIES: hypothetical protein [Methylobacterium]MDE3747498.1 hypothetical protein [Methylobacterium radiotolerans]